MEYMFRYPTKEHYLMDISREIDISHTSVTKNLKHLRQEGIIIEKAQKKGSRFFPIYKINLDSKIYRKYKRISNLLLLEESGLIDELTDLSPRCIVLFGSYQKGEDTEESDIDLYVERKFFKIDLEKYNNLLGRNIELHIKEKFNDYPIELRSNIINGTVLYGYLEAYEDTTRPQKGRSPRKDGKNKPTKAR